LPNISGCKKGANLLINKEDSSDEGSIQGNLYKSKDV